MQFLLLALLSAAIVIADQVTKFLTVANIPLYADVPVLEGVVGLTYVQNTGAAFSAFQGAQWLFAIVFVLFTAAVVWEYFKSPLPFRKYERILIAAIYGGAVGNMIDRIRLGYVVDMIKTEFINFPVFNVADIFITCGCIAMMISLIFFNKKFWKEEKK